MAAEVVIGPAKVIRTEDGADMVLIPAGEFLMGSDDVGEGKPRHRVRRFL